MMQLSRRRVSFGFCQRPALPSAALALDVCRRLDGRESGPHVLGTPATAITPSRPKVVVLMSTYNGERYVVEQLESILKQLPSDGRILVRDDGSWDETRARVEAIGDARIELSCGTNLGFGASFLTLLTIAPADADLVMFADQDDVWLPGKIERAWQHLCEFGSRPALYGSAQMLADEQLRPLRPTPCWPRLPSFEAALVENFITGCTAAINRSALALLRHAGVPPSVRFHDWWLYLVVSAFGQVVFDPTPTLLYRQHGENQIGYGIGRLGRQLQMLRFLRRNDWVGILLGQVSALQTHFRDALPPGPREIVERYFTLSAVVAPRWRLVFSVRRWRTSHELAFRLLLAAHLLRLWPLGGRRFAPSTRAV
jgi:glycosyltransferase involved in cell wall biosynthesis